MTGVDSPEPDEPRVVARPRSLRFLTSRDSSRPERLRGSAEEKVWLAKEEAQLVWEAAEAEKKASYQLGVEGIEAKLSEELPEVCRDYCSISWAHALDAAGIPADSTLRLPKKVFFSPEIREIPDCAPEASEQAMAIPDAIPLLDKAKDSAKQFVSEVPPPQPEQKENPPVEA